MDQNDSHYAFLLIYQLFVTKRVFCFLSFQNPFGGIVEDVGQEGDAGYGFGFPVTGEEFIPGDIVNVEFTGSGEQLLEACGQFVSQRTV